jgi:acyl carrier protein
MMSTAAQETVMGVLTQILVETLMLGEPADLSVHKRLVADLGMDSLDCVNVVMGLEDHFEIQLDDDALEKVTTVGEAVAVVQTTITAAGKEVPLGLDADGLNYVMVAQGKNEARSGPDWQVREVGLGTEVTFRLEDKSQPGGADERCVVLIRGEGSRDVANRVLSALRVNE